jgi:hypothetical protein
MKNKWIMIAGVITAMAVTSVQAIPITGGISLAGTYTTDTGNLNTADAFTSFSQVYVANVAGSFLGAGITMYSPGSVVMSIFSFNPFPAAGVPTLWKTVAGTFASFTLSSPISIVQGNDALTLRGVGTLNLTGYDATPGNWIFTANQAGGSFSFSSSNGSVPDGGSTAMLLGAALSAVALLRKKLIA